ncbi:MAG: 4-aminobutyrate--2-oxoglutarate transaminase [Gammaproteobacteria bacterium]|nr:4-aminobutyrate--2-oxoglutarate transaminase [Gammaproteobacteria bacterium]
MTNLDLQKRKDAATPRGAAVLCNFYAARAEGAEIWDVEGKRYIDFAAGIAVVNTGHRHPTIVRAIREQLDQFTHTAYQVVPYASYIELAERINASTPGDYAKKTAFFSTGAEAIENAIKIARAATGRSGVIAFSGGFHGRTMMALALTGKMSPYKASFGPFPGEIFHAPFPSALHDISTDDSLDALHELFKVSIDPKRVAAIILEPVQGEGGFNVAPPKFLRAIRDLCDEHGILFIADEIQTGFARTGRLFAMHHYDVTPDLMAMAKGLAGGMPLSAVCGRAEIMDAPAPGGLGGTYAGNPLAIASALAVLKVIETEQLADRANVLGQKLKDCLSRVRGKVPQMAEVRGLGAMVAAEFTEPGSIVPDTKFAKQVQTNALRDGLLLLTCGANGNVIRFLFPLTIPEALMEEGLTVLESALIEAAKQAESTKRERVA